MSSSKSRTNWSHSTLYHVSLAFYSLPLAIYPAVIPFSQTKYSCASINACGSPKGRLPSPKRPCWRFNEFGRPFLVSITLQSLHLAAMMLHFKKTHVLASNAKWSVRAAGSEGTKFQKYFGPLHKIVPDSNVSLFFTVTSNFLGSSSFTCT